MKWFIGCAIGFLVLPALIQAQISGNTLKILNQPENIIVRRGANFPLTITFTSDHILDSYWEHNGNKLPDSGGPSVGRTHVTWGIIFADFSVAGYFSWHGLTESGWVHSKDILVQIDHRPDFQSTPSDRIVVPGQTVLLQWKAIGNGRLKYDLLHDNQVIDSNLTGGFWVKAPAAGISKQYAVRVTDSLAVSDIVASVVSKLVTLSGRGSSPKIIQQPQTVVVVQGESLKMGIQAIGGDLSYQWYKGITQISGANSAEYIIDQTNAADAGTYSAIVSNGMGEATSKPIEVSFGANISTELQGKILVLKFNAGSKVASYKIQKSSDLNTWEDLQDLSENDLNGLEIPVLLNHQFFRVVQR